LRKSGHANHSAPQFYTKQAADRRGFRGMKHCHLCTRSQRLDDATLGNGAVPALIDEMVQHAAQFNQLNKACCTRRPGEHAQCSSISAQERCRSSESRNRSRTVSSENLSSCPRRMKLSRSSRDHLGPGNSREFDNGKCLGEHS